MFHSKHCTTCWIERCVACKYNTDSSESYDNNCREQTLMTSCVKLIQK